MLKLFTALVFLSLMSAGAVGCLGKDDSAGGGTGDTGSGGGGNATPKALASLWTVSNGAWTMDLTNARIDNSSFHATITQSNGTQACDVVMAFSGTTGAGTCTFYSSTWTGGGGSDPGCGSNGYGMCPNNGYTMDGTHFVFTNGATYH